MRAQAVQTIQSLTTQADSLKAQGRLVDAIQLYRAIVRSFPKSAVAEHNLAAALGDAGQQAEALDHLRRAMRMGLDAPETWLVKARCHQGLYQHDNAIRAFREVLRRQPLTSDAQLELAQLIWMSTADLAAALSTVDQTISRFPGAGSLRLVRARILEYAGARDRALETLAGAIETMPNEVSLLRAAAELAVTVGQIDRGVEFAERALRLAPRDHGAMMGMAFVWLAAGAPDRAAELAGRLRQAAPNDQHALALQATAWRMQGDPRYGQLYDYGSLVQAMVIDTPSGWPNLQAYLADLTVALKRLHPYKTHPFGQSVRHGSQLPNLLTMDDPAIRAFPQSIQGPITAYLGSIGQGTDPLRSRNTGRWRIPGIWSVKLFPSGFHSDHVHPAGWISSACYISLPAAVDAGGHEGWIKFGEPGQPTSPALGPEHFIQPKPGLLVLFPSYMWHGTVPFGGDEPRLTIAFDLLPD